jgi:hypothetical protein
MIRSERTSGQKDSRLETSTGRNTTYSITPYAPIDTQRQKLFFFSFIIFKNFLNLFYRGFAKIFGPSKFLQKYTSGAVAHGARDITPRAAALGAAISGPVPLTSQVTTFRP